MKVPEQCLMIRLLFLGNTNQATANVISNMQDSNAHTVALVSIAGCPVTLRGNALKCACGVTKATNQEIAIRETEPTTLLMLNILLQTRQLLMLIEHSTHHNLEVTEVARKKKRKTMQR